jgi:hypothetical protein
MAILQGMLHPRTGVGYSGIECNIIATLNRILSIEQPYKKVGVCMPAPSLATLTG